ncbi:MAG: HlyC/CorC family transporter [Candidatus Omnitrophica bacterium]|nr:HlyC/CorC family transporter [Candidatus Omnitrophota bacterium]
MNLINILIIIVVMVMINAVFSAFEMALASISRTRLTYLEHIKTGGATEALFMKGRMEASFAVVQLGVTLAGSIAAAIGGAGVTEVLNPFYQKCLGLSHGLAEVLSLITLIIPLSAFTIICAELIPKIFAIQNPEWVVLRLSKIMIYFYYVAHPVVFGLEFIVKSAIAFINKQKRIERPGMDTQGSLHELTAALSMARTSRLINAQQEKIAMAAAQMSLRPIREIMIPADHISMITQTCSLNDALIQAHLDMHTRFPVCQKANDPQTIVGYVNFKDIIAALRINPSDPTLGGILRPVMRFADNMVISKVLERMIQEKLHIGLIENGKKQIVGMITQEDIMEEMVGEIEDEFDRLPTHIHPYGSQWLVGGAVPMSTLAKTVGVNWSSHNDGDLKLADWCQRQMSRPFNGGEVITAGGFQVTVRKLRRKKISEAFVAKSP